MKKLNFILILLASSISLAKMPLFLRSAQELETTALPLPGKKTVCTATINSANEKDVFERKLSKSEFQFIELTQVDQWAPQTDPQKSWFDRACDSNIQCDIVIISGHFGGVFFGSSGKKLSFSDLESRSCRKDCNGILSNPKEVFLFGCNTLASKDADSRTREEYIRVLIQDGYTQNQAEEVAEARYGATGEQNRDRMRRAFLNVPYIYGFKTKAPLGPDIESALTKYVTKASPYENHLNKMSLSPEKTADQFPNPIIEAALKDIPHKGLYQCAGLSGLNKNDPYYQINLNLCQFYTYLKDPNEKMKFALQLLTSSEGRLYFPTVIKYILDTRNYQATQLPGKADLKNNLIVKDQYRKLLNDIITPVMQSQWLAAGRHMEWITSSEYQEKGLAIYKKVFTVPVNALSNEVSSTVCAMYFKDVELINKDSLAQLVTPQHLRTTDGLQATYCSGAIVNDRVLNLLRAEIKTATAQDSTALATMIGVLDHKDLTFNATTSQILTDISSVCAAKNWVMNYCMIAYARLNPQHPGAVTLANHMIKNKIGDIKTALQLLTKAGSRYTGPELDIINTLPLNANSGFIIYGDYLIQFPPQSEAARQVILNRIQKCSFALCSGLIEAIQTTQIAADQFINLTRLDTTDIDFWKSIYLLGSNQSKFTVTMAQELFKKEIFFGDFVRIANALMKLMDNTRFQEAILQDQTALENMCGSLANHNRYKGITPVQCFDKISSWTAATSNISAAKAVAFKALEQNRYSDRTSAKNYLLKIKNQLSTDEQQKLQNY